MIQGTGSHVGKSLLTAALCRIFKEDGVRVAPFKSQNMALNSFVTEDGREMGRAQVVQAEAAGLKPDVHMNPILLKPQSDRGSQVIIHGKVYKNLTAAEYQLFKREAMKYVSESYQALSDMYDLIVIEGAGSPAEINLREDDIANMGTSHMADAPVILVGDIDRGGVFASLVGTLELLDEADRKRIKGFIINKFRGDIALLMPAVDFLEKKTGLPVFGVIPYFQDIYIQEEDSLYLQGDQTSVPPDEASIKIAVISLPHVSNFTDFDPFLAEEGVHLRYVKSPERIGDVDIIMIPGTKNVLADLEYLREKGYAGEIGKHIKQSGMVIGICGGYQMLGKKIADPKGVERGGEAAGLGCLDIETVFSDGKSTYQVEAIPVNSLGLRRNQKLTGYEIHMGETSYDDNARPLFTITSRGGNRVSIKDGALSRDGKVWGTYIHGIFDADWFRRDLIDYIRKEKGMSQCNSHATPPLEYSDAKESGYQKLAEIVRANLDMTRIYKIIGFPNANRKIRCEVL